MSCTKEDSTFKALSEKLKEYAFNIAEEFGIVPPPCEELPENFQAALNANNKKLLKKYNAMRHEHLLYFYQKRIFSVGISAIAIAALSPAALAAIIYNKITEPKESPFYSAERASIGRSVMHIIKIRSMRKSLPKGTDPAFLDQMITAGNDPRVTALGKIIRKIHLDEYPQLFDCIVRSKRNPFGLDLVGLRPENMSPAMLHEGKELMIYTRRQGICSHTANLFFNEGEAMDRIVAAYKEHQKKRLSIGLDKGEDALTDKVYDTFILPLKTKYLLKECEQFSIDYDVKVFFEACRLYLGRQKPYDIGKKIPTPKWNINATRIEDFIQH